jgi:hypothetical protein
VAVVIFRQDIWTGRRQLVFTGLPEKRIAQWCIWYHEYLEDEAAEVDCETAQLKEIIDALIKKSPAGGLSKAVETSLWYNRVTVWTVRSRCHPHPTSRELMQNARVRQIQPRIPHIALDVLYQMLRIRCAWHEARSAPEAGKK